MRDNRPQMSSGHRLLCVQSWQVQLALCCAAVGQALQRPCCVPNQPTHLKKSLQMSSKITQYVLLLAVRCCSYFFTSW